MSGSYIERLREIGSEIASDATLSASQRELALQGVEDALNALRGAESDSGLLQRWQDRPRRVLGVDAGDEGRELFLVCARVGSAVRRGQSASATVKPLARAMSPAR